MSENHVKEHVDLIARHEQEFLANRTRGERIGDGITRFAGRLEFVGAQLAAAVAWMAWNMLGPLHERFDPVPFGLLGTIVSLEAIVLASLILARQQRMGRRGEERDHLMLQVLLLSERELTAVLELERQIAQRVGLQHLAENDEMRAFSEPTSLEGVTKVIRESLTDLEEPIAESTEGAQEVRDQ